MKKEARIIGFDDGPFKKLKDKKTIVIGAIYRGGLCLDGLISFYVKVDGNDATQKLIKAINKTKHKGQLRYIITNGIAFGGFNIIDIKKVYKKTKLPLIVVMRKKPNMKKFVNAIKHLKDFEKRLKVLKKAGEIKKILHLYVQSIGIDKKAVEELIKISCTRSNIPEPLRAAHLIASGVVDGESRGHA